MSQRELKPMLEKRLPRYGDIYEVDLEPVVGDETGKRRPALIVSNDINNEFSETVTVLPMTSHPANRQYPFEVLVPGDTPGLTKGSRIKANQVRTVDKRRLVGFRGALPAQYLPEVEKALKIHLNIR